MSVAVIIITEFKVAKKAENIDMHNITRKISLNKDVVYICY